MSTVNKEEIELAYKYPFSKDAKKIITESEQKIDKSLLEYGRIRVQNAMNDKEIEIDDSYTDNIKLIHVQSYVYARMIISAINSVSYLRIFSRYEAKMSVAALLLDSEENILKISEQIGTGIKKENNLFVIGVVPFLINAPKTSDFLLIKQILNNGKIYLKKEELSRFLSKRIEKEIMKNLPIPKQELPEEVIEYAKKIKVPVEKINFKKTDIEKYKWIEKLLFQPIADVRHRTVNLILAPYLINVKKLTEEESIKIIHDYIKKCKEINPDTNVNESYIRYQVRYSKAKGMKPLSLQKAKELLGETVI